MALGRSDKRSRRFVVPRLQITAMMDMFTIILIFLLFSFSSDPETIELERNLELPKSTAKMGYKESIKLVLSNSSLKLDDKVVAKLKNGRITGLDKTDLKKSVLYHQLTLLRLKNEKQDFLVKNQHILFLCDRRLPFKTINTVIKTAGLAGFPDFQFAVLKK